MFENNFNKKERPLLGLASLGGGFSSGLTGGGPIYFLASGGTHEFTIASAPSPTGYYRYHVFTGTDTLTTNMPSLETDSLSVIMVAGGGSGGSGVILSGGGGFFNGAGGGAGGRIYATGPTLALDAGTYTITIGAGGGPNSNGQDTTISTPTTTLFTAVGGGKGFNNNPGGGLSSVNPGFPGGSGGGGAFYGQEYTRPPAGVAGRGTVGQGNPGGDGNYPGEIYNASGMDYMYASGGGGGAGGSGTNSRGSIPQYGGPAIIGNGGSGAPSPEFSSTLISSYVPTIPAGSLSEIGPTGMFAGGGGAGRGAYGRYPTHIFANQLSGGIGGSGGGGNGSAENNVFSATVAENGFFATGGGGGGDIYPSPKNGGSGVVMIRYAVPGL